MHFPKSPGGIVGLLFKIFGLVAMSGPAIVSVQGALARNDFSTIGTDLVYNYTGYSPATGQFNAAQTGAAVAAVGGGIALVYLGKFISKLVR